MGIIVGTSTLAEVANNGNNVLEVQGNYCGIERITAVSGRSAGNVPDNTVVDFNTRNVNNHPSGGQGSGGYTAPWDGAYMIYYWSMIDNDNLERNDYYDIEINGSFFQRWYGSNGTRVHRESATGVVAVLSEGDVIRVRTRNIRLYGNGSLYSRFNVVFLG